MKQWNSNGGIVWGHSGTVRWNSGCNSHGGTVWWNSRILMVKEWNSNGGTVWGHSGTAVGAQCGGTVEQWDSIGGTVEQC